MYQQNLIVFYGNVGKEVKSHITDNGKIICRFSLAHKLYETNSDGSNKDPLWLDVSFIGDQNGGYKSVAQRAAEELKTGDPVEVTGRLSHYKGNDGKYYMEIKATFFQKHPRADQPATQQAVAAAVPAPQYPSNQPAQPLPPAYPQQVHQNQLPQGQYAQPQPAAYDPNQYPNPPF